MAYSLIAFDLDGTLALSKTKVDEEMVELLKKLLSKYKVAVISGAKFEQFEKELLEPMGLEILLQNLFVLPTNGSAFYFFQDGNWIEKYKELLSDEQKENIKVSLEKAVRDSGVDLPEKTYGLVIEDRETQISWSALGQKAPLEFKSVWDPDQEKRQKIRQILQELLPDFEIKIGGTTTIDITRRGIDKGYALKKVQEHVGCSKAEMFFIGDALFPGGNDWAAHEFGIETKKVNSIDDTKREIRKFL